MYIPSLESRPLVYTRGLDITYPDIFNCVTVLSISQLSFPGFWRHVPVTSGSPWLSTSSLMTPFCNYTHLRNWASSCKDSPKSSKNNFDDSAEMACTHRSTLLRSISVLQMIIPMSTDHYLLLQELQTVLWRIKDASTFEEDFDY